MKFVNNGLVAPQQVWVLTDQQVNSLNMAGIGFEDLPKLPTLLERMSEQDVIDIAVTQYRAALKLRISEKTPFEQFNDDYKDILLSKIKSEQDRLSKLEHLKELKDYSKFYVHNTNDMLVLVIADYKVSGDYISELCASFTELHVSTFSEALTRALYQTHGYLYLHNQEVIGTLGEGQFSMATVYKALV